MYPYGVCIVSWSLEAACDCVSFVHQPSTNSLVICHLSRPCIEWQEGAMLLKRSFLSLDSRCNRTLASTNQPAMATRKVFNLQIGHCMIGSDRWVRLEEKVVLLALAFCSTSTQLRATTLRNPLQKREQKIYQFLSALLPPRGNFLALPLGTAP